MSKRKRGEDEYEIPERNTVSDQDDNAVRVVNAPTPANRCLERQIQLLLDKSTISAVLDIFLAMRLSKGENTELCKAFENTDISKNLIKTLKETDNDEDGNISGKTLELIGDLMRNNSSMRKDFVRNGAIIAIAETMKLFLQNEKLQQHGSRALFYILKDEYWKGASNIESFYDLFYDVILNVLAEVMRKYPMNISIQKQIIAFLSCITCTYTNDEMIEKVIQMKCVEYTLNALSKYNSRDILFRILSFKLLTNLNKIDAAKACLREKDLTLILAKIEKFDRKKSDDELRI